MSAPSGGRVAVCTYSTRILPSLTSTTGPKLAGTSRDAGSQRAGAGGDQRTGAPMSAVNRNLVWLLISQAGDVGDEPSSRCSSCLGSWARRRSARTASSVAYVGFFGLAVGLGTSTFLVREIARDHSVVPSYLFNAMVLKLVLTTVLGGVAMLARCRPAVLRRGADARRHRVRRAVLLRPQRGVRGNADRVAADGQVVGVGGRGGVPRDDRRHRRARGGWRGRRLRGDRRRQQRVAAVRQLAAARAV